MPGAAVDASGTLRREGAGFVLDDDDGRRLRLELGRVPVDAVEKRVQVLGTALSGDWVEVDGVARLG